MREIVQIQLGQCGNSMGTKFWEVVLYDHALDSLGHFCGGTRLQAERLNVFFNEGPKDNFVPRAIMVDLQPGTLDGIRGGPLGRLFRPDQMIHGDAGGGNVWAKGFLTHGPEIVDPVMDAIRRETERCDCLQGFQLCHALGGGTGSGLGCLLMEKLRDRYSDRIICTYSVLPSTKVTDTVVGPYNAILSMRHLIEKTNMTFCIDNEALYNIGCRSLRLRKPTYGDLNHLVSQAMCGITSSLRFPGQLNADLRKLATTMVAFRDMHFFTSSFAPLVPRIAHRHFVPTVRELTNAVFDSDNMLVACGETKGRYLTAAVMFRGQVSIKEVNKEMVRMQHGRRASFTNWIKNGINSSVCDVAPWGLKMAATFIGNTTAIREPFDRILTQYRKMLKSKAYFHWYENEGMQEQDFKDAEDKLTSIMSDYQRLERGQHGPLDERIEEAEKSGSKIFSDLKVSKVSPTKGDSASSSENSSTSSLKDSKKGSNDDLNDGDDSDGSSEDGEDDENETENNETDGDDANNNASIGSKLKGVFSRVFS